MSWRIKWKISAQLRQNSTTETKFEQTTPVELDAKESLAFGMFTNKLYRDIARIEMKLMEARSGYESWSDFLDRVGACTAPREPDSSFKWRTAHQRELDGCVEELEFQLRAVNELYEDALQEFLSRNDNSNNSAFGVVELDDTRVTRIGKGKKHRPCTEPPILDYSSFELIIAAQKELDKKLGSRDIAWRTEGMDTVVEADLLNSYNSYLLESLAERSDAQESAFLYGLKLELQRDFEEVRMNMVQVAERHGKGGYALQELITGIRDIAQRNNPTATIELSAFSYYERYPIELPSNADEGGHEE